MGFLLQDPGKWQSAQKRGDSRSSRVCVGWPHSQVRHQAADCTSPQGAGRASLSAGHRGAIVPLHRAARSKAGGALRRLSGGFPRTGGSAGDQTQGM